MSKMPNKFSTEVRERAVPRLLDQEKEYPVVDSKPAPGQQQLTPKAAAETVQGTGLGEILSETEGRARLKAFTTLVTAEAWAGPLAEPTELEREFGIARSTLHTWQQQGSIITVLVGMLKHAFPIAQFIDGRPVAGLAPLVETVGDARTAWRWLREPNPGLSGATPLSRLKAGAIEPVLAIARSNFGRQ
ncbi:MAG TPA: MbcA/ParS/Xre antitoxin family protein [Rhizomicrobium sp.]|nr:MbcA/ParS/Xre antitoxin family protein [Rhizomicrobium sp.]